MTAATFDTLAYAKKLKAVGVPPDQAEVQAEALYEIIDEKLATKKDIIELRTELKRDIKELTYKLTLRLGSMVITSFIATVGTLGFLMNWMLKGVH